MYETYWELITPELAASKYIPLNTDNRKLQPRHVMRLRKAMERREWIPNGDAICVSDTNVLLNGQHTLHAIMASGLPQMCLVVKGLPEAAFGTKDKGLRRKEQHDLGRCGYINSYQLSAAIQILWSYENYRSHQSPQEGRLTSQQMIEICARFPDLPESVAGFLKSETNQNILTPAIGSALFFAGRKYIDVRNSFFETLHGRLAATMDHPAAALRDRMQVERQPHQKRSSDKYRFALAIKAWNFAFTGSRVKCLKVDVRENFPVILGYGMELSLAFPQWASDLRQAEMARR